MCDQDILGGMEGVTRRQFTRMGVVLGAGAGLSACTTYGGEAAGLAETNVSFAAPGGIMDGFFVHPASGRHPGVILWPDIAGVRDANKAMARRLAAEGYTVFVANPYYRSVAGEPFADFAAFREAGMDKVAPWRAANTPAAIAETARATVAWLDRQEAVDTARGIGNQGYCMTGGWTFYTAAAMPARVKAAASFHGGQLVGEDLTAPINLLDDMADDARALIAIARDDDAKAPEDQPRLVQAAAAAGLDAEIEVYQGDHGWTVLDSPSYRQDEADRAWRNLLELYSATL